jgi:hypothetical protein
MVWARKGFVHLLSLILLVSLVGGAFAVSTNLNLTHPEKLQTWLNQTNFYSSFVANELHDAQQSASNDLGAGRVSLSDPAVEQAVRSVFSPALLQQYTSTFLNSNYAWLEGKTDVPNFRIDLMSAKQKLAQQVGQRVQTRAAGLTACSAAQLTQLQTTLNTDPLSVPCRPPSLSPQTAGKQATDQINASSDFLNNPVITAKTLNPNGKNQGQPYYQKLSALPKLYRLNLKLPWIFGSLALLSTLGILFVSSTRRRGVRRVGWVLLAAGVLLIIVKFVADSVFNHLEKKVFNNSNIGQLQLSLTDFLHRMEAQLVKVDLWFGIAFLVVAVLLLNLLWFTRKKSGGVGSSQHKPSTPSGTPGEEQGVDGRPQLPVLKQPPRPKRPRLIQ